jgi:hypothetical protein
LMKSTNESRLGPPESRTKIFRVGIEVVNLIMIISFQVQVWKCHTTASLMPSMRRQELKLDLIGFGNIWLKANTSCQSKQGKASCPVICEICPREATKGT